MGPAFIIAQIFGLGAVISFSVSFQSSTTKKICVFQAVGCTFMTAQFFLLGAYTGAILNFLSLFRAILYASTKKWTEHPIWPWVFCVLNVIFTVFTWEGLHSILPMTALIISSFSLKIPNAQLSRAVTLPTSPMWLVYDIVTKAYVSMINEAVIMCSIILGLLRYYKKGKNAR